MYTGPHIIKDGLVFGYDTGYGIADNGSGTRFYKGEPTTNILPSPEKNGRFTTENQWSTYNTNQYNSNTYFSIGTVSGVSNNIVTLSSVGRTIRSFDVLKAQTTGGGITAGTNYVVKKLSSNTFSLHEYNSSQNGSQGYINPSTGFFKVHDAYANDTRISINATDFPTMWWGAPHLPNSGLIKEIVPNAGYVKGTNALRLHVYRGDGVADGMAYSVYTPVTQGDVITVSYWARPTNQLGYGKSLGYSTYFGAGNSASSFSTNLNSDGEWQLITHTWTASTTFSFYSYFWPGGSTDKWAVDLADLQVEVNKGHATPFTLSSRGDTASLIDLKETTDIDVSDVSFDSTGQPEFDGTDDYIELSDALNSIGSAATFEMVFKATETNDSYRIMLGWGHGNNNYSGIHIGNWTSSYTDESFHVNFNAGALLLYIRKGHTFYKDNTYHHAIITASPNNYAIWIDGIKQSITVGGGTQSTTFTNLIGYNSNIVSEIGRRPYGGGSGFFKGEIPVMKVYDTVLSDEEIKQNYNAYKNRFDI